VLIRYEYYLAGAWLLAALFLSRREDRWRRPCRLFRRLGRNPAMGVFLVGLVAAVGSAFVSLAIAWPEPRIHDEFSYLLAADTFAHGRLTNPPHPMCVHFETFHVNQLPTYCSIYPPGQGLMMALGQVLGGHPLVGVWLSFGLACAAVCWMLQAFMPGRWAVAGGLLAAARFGLVAGNSPGYWGQSYWGGAVAMMGGALALGACRRLVVRRGLAFGCHGFGTPNPCRASGLNTGSEYRTCGTGTRKPCRDVAVVSERRACYALLLGLGLAVLANSRPFEGALFGLPIAAALSVWLVRRGKPYVKIALARVVLPLCVLLGLTLAGMVFYNARLTGSPLRMPYQQNGMTYGLVPLFLWQPLKAEPAYNHAVIRDYHVKWAAAAYFHMRSIEGYLAEIGNRLRTLVNFYAGPILLVPLLALPVVLRNRWSRFAALVCAIVLAGLSVTTWMQPHYAAPLAGVVMLFVVQGLRHLRVWRPAGRPVGAALVRTLPVAYAGLLLVSLAARSDAESHGWHRERARLLSELQQLSGQHLVLVRYATDHIPHDEWVFNEADIDGAKVIWARDLSGQPVGQQPFGASLHAPPNETRCPNQSLIDYFSDRSVWLLDADEKPAVLRPYK
jgi:hypothetical protein